MLLGFTILCDVISAVTEFMARVLRSGLLLRFTMLCDVISAVTELMVRVLQLALAIGIHDGTRVEARPYVSLGCPFSDSCPRK